jgi:hypothetical protein
LRQIPNAAAPLGCGVEARPAGLEVATVPPPLPTCGKNHCGRRRADLFTLPSSLRALAAPMALGGSYHAKSLRPGLHRARSPGRRRSCRNDCDRSCRGELRGLRWSLRKRLSPSLRLAPLVIVGSYGTRSSPTHPITRRHDSQLANPPSSQASQQSTRTLCIWPRPVRRCPETTESCGLRGHSSHPASAFRDCPADVGLDARVKAVHDETGSAALIYGRHLRMARDRRQKLLSSGFRGTAEPRLIKVGCSIFRHDAWRRLRWDPMLHRSKE